MQAIFEIGGKQYRAAPNAVLRTESISADKEAVVVFDRVLFLDSGKEGKPEIGTPYLAGVRVSARVLAQSRAKEILVFRKKRRKNFRRLNGHRQKLTVLRVLDILDER